MSFPQIYKKKEGYRPPVFEDKHYNYICKGIVFPREVPFRVAGLVASESMPILGDLYGSTISSHHRNFNSSYKKLPRFRIVIRYDSGLLKVYTGRIVLMPIEEGKTEREAFEYFKIPPIYWRPYKNDDINITSLTVNPRIGSRAYHPIPYDEEIVHIGFVKNRDPLYHRDVPGIREALLSFMINPYFYKPKSDTEDRSYQPVVKTGTYIFKPLKIS